RADWQFRSTAFRWAEREETGRGRRRRWGPKVRVVFEALPYYPAWRASKTTRTFGPPRRRLPRSEEHTSELQSLTKLVYPLLLHNAPSTPDVSSLSLHAALPISC